MKHYLIGMGILLGTALCHFGVLYAQLPVGPKAPNYIDIELPSRIGQYQQYGEDIDPGDEVRRKLETSSILMRHYVAPGGAPILVTIVYAGKSRRSLHFPEICFVGQGWEIEQAYLASVGMEFRAKRLVIFHGDQKQAVVYWFKTGDRFTGNPFMNSLYWSLEQLRFGTSTSSMIKLSMPIQGSGKQGEEQAFAALDDMAQRMAPILLENIR